MNHNNASERALFISIGPKLLESSETYQIKPITNNHLRHNVTCQNEYTGFYFTNHEIKQCCHFLVNKCKIFKMLIETLFLRLFEPDQSEIKEIFQEIVNIHTGGDF